MANGYDWQQVSHPEALGDLGGEWDNLARLQGWPLAERAWLEPAIRHLERRSIVRLWLLLRDGRLHGSIALATRKGRIGAVDRPVGAAALGESNALLAADDESSSELLRRLFRLGRPLALLRMLDAERIQRTIAVACGRRGRLFEARSSGFPTLDIADGFDVVLAGLSSGRRSTLRRKRRRLAGTGHLDFSSNFPGEQQVDEYLARFAAVEDAGWKGREGSSLRRRPGLMEFFSDALQRFARERRVRFDQLTLDGRVVAAQFGLVSGNRYMLLKPTYDEGWSEYSPGYLLTLEAIHRSVEAGLRHYEFLGTSYAWKLHWSKDMRSTRTWVFYPFNLRGAAAAASDLASVVGRRLRG